MILAVLLLTPYKSNNGLDDFKKSVIKCGYQVVLLWFNMNLFHHFSRLHLHHYTSTHPSFFFFFPASWCWCFTRSGKQNRFWKTLIKHQGYHNSVLFSHSCVVLLPPPLLSQVLEPVQGTAEPSGRIKISCSVRSLSVQLLAWLTEGLKGARARGKRGNVTKGGGILP